MTLALPLLGLVFGFLVYVVVFRTPLREAQSTLSTCEACGGAVQSDAIECRHCGAAFEPASRPKRERTRKTRTQHPDDGLSP